MSQSGGQAADDVDGQCDSLGNRVCRDQPADGEVAHLLERVGPRIQGPPADPDAHTECEHEQCRETKIGRVIQVCNGGILSHVDATEIGIQHREKHLEPLIADSEQQYRRFLGSPQKREEDRDYQRTEGRQGRVRSRQTGNASGDCNEPYCRHDSAASAATTGDLHGAAAIICVDSDGNLRTCTRNGSSRVARRCESIYIGPRMTEARFSKSSVKIVPRSGPESAQAYFIGQEPAYGLGQRICRLLPANVAVNLVANNLHEST